MPHYSYERTFTAGTDKTTQEELIMECAWGVLTNMVISFPAGCHGVCHVHIDDELHQVFPTNPDGNYAFDDIAIPINDRYDLLPSKRKIYLRGWNEGIYDHTICVAFEVEPFDRRTAAEKVLLQILSLLQRLFRIK